MSLCIIHVTLAVLSLTCCDYHIRNRQWLAFWGTLGAFALNLIWCIVSLVHGVMQ